MPSKILTVRVPPGLVARLNRYAANNFEHRADVIRAAIESAVASERCEEDSDHADV